MVKRVMSYYTDTAFKSNVALLAHAEKSLHGVDYDTMVGRGLSGALVIPFLARSLGKHFVIVRKSDENSHASKNLEGVFGDRWIFVDDFLCSGSTRRAVLSEVERAQENYEFETTHVGSYLYTEIAGDRYSYQAVSDYRVEDWPEELRPAKAVRAAWNGGISPELREGKQTDRLSNAFLPVGGIDDYEPVGYLAESSCPVRHVADV